MFGLIFLSFGLDLSSLNSSHSMSVIFFVLIAESRLRVEYFFVSERYFISHCGISTKASTWSNGIGFNHVFQSFNIKLYIILSINMSSSLNGIRVVTTYLSTKIINDFLWSDR